MTEYKTPASSGFERGRKIIKICYGFVLAFQSLLQFFRFLVNLSQASLIELQEIAYFRQHASAEEVGRSSVFANARIADGASEAFDPSQFFL